MAFCHPSIKRPWEGRDIKEKWADYSNPLKINQFFPILYRGVRKREKGIRTWEREGRLFLETSGTIPGRWGRARSLYSPFPRSGRRNS
jgi:hypothetical protein